MRRAHHPRMLPKLMHICRNSHRTVNYNLTGLLDMHIFFADVRKHLSMPCSFLKSCSLTSALRNKKIYAKNENKQMQCYKADIRCAVSRVEQSDIEIEDKEEYIEEKFIPESLEPNTVEAYEDVSYYVENGLRKVYPYYFTYRTFVKERWVGQKLLNILQNEFRTLSTEEYIWRFQNGVVTVNNEKVEMDYRVKLHDYIQSTLHRHEAPVMYKPLPIIHLDKDILVIDKPPSIPVHPCGEYRYNSILFILAKEYNLRNIRCVHRLDRLASGLLIFGRTREMAQVLAHQIRNREVKKEYVCRVIGEFPDKVIECREPVEAVDSKIAIGKVSANGKPSLTTFQKLSYNGKSSVVLCKPTTGRMHQIRIHLQFLGYPILNDSLYNNHKVADLCKTNVLIQVPLETHSAELCSGVEKYSNQHYISNVTENDFPQPLNLKSTPASSQLTFKYDKHCLECKLPRSDPDFSELIIYLHAWKYEGKGWSYKTTFPDWAQETWTHE